MNIYDIIVIGSGPGGYVAAIRAAQLELKTAIVEKDPKLGGTCLLRGCIPTKSLLHSADVLREMQNAKEHGVIAKDVSFDFEGVQKAREKIVQKSAAGVAYLMKQNKIDVVQGFGRLKDATTVVVEGAAGEQTLHAKKIILAMGSVPRVIPSIKIDGKFFVTSNEAMELKTPPQSLLILGGGAIGVEFASIYQRFGTQCTIVEMLDHLLPIEDTEVSIEFEKLLKKRGVAVHTSTKLEKAEVIGNQVVATLATQSKAFTLEADMMLVAVGRGPVTQDMGLEKAGIKLERGFVTVDKNMQTSVPGVYAIGDIVPTPLLAHVASSEAILAVEHAAGKKVTPINYDHVPSCTYSDPEVASVGLSERAAKERGYAVKVGKFPFTALGKARILGQAEGFVKIVSDAAYDEVLGVHIVGPRATDLIAEACVALRLECTTEELAKTMHAHPTLPEAVLEAAHATLGHAIHI
jgi:dihydrolipoamide dehydrogenase